MTRPVHGCVEERSFQDGFRAGGEREVVGADCGRQCPECVGVDPDGAGASWSIRSAARRAASGSAPT